MILPAPDPAFAWRHTPYGPALVCTPLEAVAPHVFTSRAWTLGRDRHAGESAWHEVGAACGVAHGELVRLTQVHGATTVVADAVERDENGAWARPEADLLMTDSVGRAIAAQAADCVPLLYADVRRGAVLAAHAGWRGLAQGVPGVAVRALAARYGSRPDDLLVAIGPAVGACCYEVGPDVRAAFDAAFTPADVSTWFHALPQPTSANPSMPGLPPAPRDGHAYFDGWAAARRQLVLAGVPDDAIYTARLCTASYSDVLCSYRRDGRDAGRMVGVIARRAPGVTR